MSAAGKFYRMNEKLSYFPSIASSLLKFKKHEWIIIAFEKEHVIDLIWVNKGQNKSSVQIFLQITEIVNISINEKRSAVLVFHNHPNEMPGYIDCTKPSNTDIEKAKNWSIILNENGINHIEFICERVAKLALEFY